MDNREVAERCVQALNVRDPVGVADLLHPDIIVRYPQSREVIRGRDAYLEMLSNYPDDLPPSELEIAYGGRKEVQVSSTIPFGPPTVTVIGSGETFVVEGLSEYPDGVYHVVMILRIRNGRVIEGTSYFARPFEAPEWREPFVEHE